MKKSSRTSVLFCALLLAGIAGCKLNKASKTKDTVPTEAVSTSFQDEHSSRNSVDWYGTYQGVIPCGDCKGIKTRLTLMENGEFNRTQTYLGEEKTGSTDSGTFEWSETGSDIVLNPAEGASQRYQVGENRLFQLDQKGKRITGNLAGEYVLVKNKADYRLENKKWILAELMGKKVSPGKGTQEAFLYFDRELGMISGNNSCNVITGAYDLKEGNRISFDRVASTLMACPEMETADQFNEVLERTDNYTVADGILSLNKARMAPLARFREE